jgi:cGMP-dependent protein kinase 1
MGICVNGCKNSNLSPYGKGNENGETGMSKISTKKHKMSKPGVDERAKSEFFIEAKNAIISSKPKDDRDISLILSVLKNHYIFNSIDKESQFSIIKKVKCYELSAKETVFEQGQPGVCFFVVSLGKLEVKVNNERTILNPGMSFGELALIDARPRTATVRTIEPTVLWGLDRETFTKALKKIRKQEYEENKKFVQSAGIFNLLTGSQKESLLDACVTQKWSAGQIIIKEGDNSNMFYIVKEGVAVCNPETADLREIHKGDYFGEHALLYQRPRLGTVIAATDLKLLSIGRESLLQVLGNNLESILFRNSQRIALERSLPLKFLSVKQREAILDKTCIKNYKKGDVVVNKGKGKSEMLWIVIRGKISGCKDVGNLQCLGDDDLTFKNEEVYESDFIAVEKSDIAEITVQVLEDSIGGEISQVTLHNDAMGVLRQVQLLRGLSQDRINALILSLKIINFEDGQVIVQQNNPGHSFFIIKSGSVKVYKNENYVRKITKNDYFGERSVLFNDFRTATVIADGETSCWKLEREDFISIISEKIREKLIKRIELQDTSVFLDEIIPLKIISTGDLGNVILGIHSQKKVLYAVKSIIRSRIEEYNIHHTLILEKKILMQLDHIMIVKLIKTFKDPLRIYFLMEYVKGKDLFDVLSEIGRVSEEQAKFYAACLVVTLEYIHERNIIHRDLKPENIMIDDEGYTKLLDFGASAIVEGRTYTTIGTPYYLAPEIILKVGYSYAVDWWSLGVLVHEMIYQYVPFGQDEDDPIAIYQQILECRLEFGPSPYKTNFFQVFLKQLLNKNPAVRTCGGSNFLKKNPWFENYNWDRLMSRQLRPPYSPKVPFNEYDIEIPEQFATIDSFLSDIESAQTTSLYKRSKTQKTHEKHWDENF